MVYSTCALDPLQNEAVVHAAISEFGTAIELISPSEMLSRSTELNLKRGRGLAHWRVPHPDFPSVPTLYATWEEVPEGLREVRSVTCVAYATYVTHL